MAAESLFMDMDFVALTIDGGKEGKIFIVRFGSQTQLSASLMVVFVNQSLADGALGITNYFVQPSHAQFLDVIASETASFIVVLIIAVFGAPENSTRTCP